jgi:hypothetical protein
VHIVGFSNSKCVLIFSSTFAILKRIRRDMNVNVDWSSGKVPVILVGF